MPTDLDNEARTIAHIVVAMASDHDIGREEIHAFYVNDALLSGRYENAREAVAPILRTGSAPAAIQSLAADLLEQSHQSRRRGRPGHKRPSRWMEIGSAYGREREHHTKNIPTIIAEKYGVSESEAKRASAFYKKVMIYTDEEFERIRVKK